MRRSSYPTDAVGVDADKPIQIDCYVRPNVSRVSVRQIEAIESRLEELAETPVVEDYQIRQWPPQRQLPVEEDTTREELVTEFEHWADRNDYSLEPAFRRRMVPSALVDDDETGEEIRVPIVTLAAYEADRESLRGVVPCTVNPDTNDAQTHTVDDWLTAVETEATARTPRAGDTDNGTVAERS